MKDAELSKTMLKLCKNFEKSKKKNFLYVECLELFLNFEDSELEKVITCDIVQNLLHVFDICRRCDIIHTKVFKIFQKIPLKINSDKEITNRLKNFCYCCKLERGSLKSKEMTNVSTHFLYQLMEFFEFKGENEYDGILKTWVEELKDLFGKKLLMESDMSDLEESHLKHSALEINADFTLFGGDSDKKDDMSGTGTFDFDFTQNSENLKNSENEAQGFGMSHEDFDNPPLLNSSKKKVNHLENFDFDDFGDTKTKSEKIPESPIKNSSKNGKIFDYFELN